jgi:hypothetical protein
MATIEGICGACSSAIKIRASHVFQNERLVWWRAYHCSACGNQIEEDGHGDPPDDIKLAILQQDGEWGLMIDPQQVDRRMIVFIKIMRQTLKLSLRAAADLSNRLPGPLVIGTRAEMDQFVHLLKAGEITASVIRIPLSAN